MMFKVQTVPELLVVTRGNITEVARMTNSDRNTIRKYARDFSAANHIVINGRLMVCQGKRGKS
ncbi:phage NinH family protein [Klebsiella quasipneumoniae]|nr:MULTISPECIES: protein ninH [Klebsiella]HCB1065395.1 protein ninH [Klebsiella variicola subsp. variicola]HDX9111797.1 protein ninH [Klebsiella michiganensis]KAA0473578.1 protein ninH [Klebsiella variicola]MBY8385106.1 phage NinH family protein [Klebsiella quasipneumoniae]MDP1297902.1 protein ninH [Klebsiella quasipneumoniae]